VVHFPSGEFFLVGGGFFFAWAYSLRQELSATRALMEIGLGGILGKSPAVEQSAKNMPKIKGSGAPCQNGGEQSSCPMQKSVFPRGMGSIDGRPICVGGNFGHSSCSSKISNPRDVCCC